jgi:hypothetical protein
MTSDVASRLSTDTRDIADLAGAINGGEIKVPQFQRRFVWDEGDAFELLDSIANSYPIGSLLLWKTVDKLAVERNIGEFTLPETDDMSPTDRLHRIRCDIRDPDWLSADQCGRVHVPARVEHTLDQRDRQRR